MENAQLSYEELILENQSLRAENSILRAGFSSESIVYLFNEHEQVNNKMQALNNELREKNNKISDSEQKLRAVFDILDVGITITNDDGDIIDCNRASEKILGVTKEEHLSRNYVGLEWNIVRPDNTKMPQDEYASVRAMREKVPVRNVIMGIVHKNTSTTWISVNAIPLNIPGYGVVVTYYDITASIRAKEQLLASEVRFRHAIDSSPVPISLHRLNGEFINFNKQFVHTFKYTTSDILDLRQWLLQVFPDIDYRKKMISLWKKAIQTLEHPHGEIEREEVNMICADGTLKIVVMGCKKSDDFYILTYDDITERKKVELDLQKHKELLDHNEQIIKVGGWLYTPSKQELYRTKGLIDIEAFEFKKTFDKSFQNLRHYSLTDQVRLKAAFDACLEHGEECDIELPFELSGQEKWVRIKMCPIREGNQIIQIVGSVADITEQKQIEIQLRSLNATKDKFFSIIAHDLKSPFNAIMGFSELILEKIRMADYEMVAKYSEVVLTSATQAFNLLDNLLSWSRAQTGRIEFKPRRIHLNTLFDEVARLFYSNIQRKKIHLYVAISPNLEVEADKFMLETVLRNLISNAIKFTNESGEIQVSALYLDDKLDITVTDSGVGIPLSRIEKLFHVGESVSTLGTENEKGTGLGLILSHEFITLHQGKLTVTSQLGKGSSFRILIPRYNDKCSDS